MILIATLLVCFLLGYILYKTIIQYILDVIGEHQARKQNKTHYDEGASTLVIYQRHPSIANQIEINPNYEVNIKHVDDRHIYTGASFGGVTVGEITTYKGGDHLVQGPKTGYYSLYYKYVKRIENGGYSIGYISYIELSIGNYMAAKKDPIICKFIEPIEATKGNLIYSTDKLTPKKRTSEAIPDSFSSDGRLKLPANSLTLTECEYLRDWLSSAYAEQDPIYEQKLRESMFANEQDSVNLLFDIVGKELRKYNYEANQDKIVTVPDGINTIGSRAFWGATKLKEVILPNSVKHISYEAFSGCTALCKINVPENATIENNAFAKCKKLANSDGFVIINNHLLSYLGVETDIVVPNGVHTIHANAFAQNKKLISIKLPDSIKSVDNAFVCGCKSLEKIVIPQHITLTASMFKDCPKLIDKKGFLVVNNTLLLYNGRDSNIVIPDGVETICANVFERNQIIKSVKCPISVKVIEAGSFANCPTLDTVELSPNLKVIEKETFHKCKTLKTVIIPQGVEQISTGAFWQCPSLTSILIPESTKSICKNAFRKCARLEKIILSDSQANVPLDVYATCDLAQIVYLNESSTEESSLTGNGTPGIFDKKTFIVSGVSKSEEHRIKKEILSHGGILDKSVTRRLDYLICSEARYGITARIDTAMNNKIKGCKTSILTVDEFDQLVATSSSNQSAPAI